MYGDIGQKSNTMIFSDRPGDVNALLAHASTTRIMLKKGKAEQRIAKIFDR